MTDYGPIVRIALRYIIGACFLGSQSLGDQLAADPDLIAIGSVIVAGLVEWFYHKAKKNGGAT